jgi:hypothetical protein
MENPRILHRIYFDDRPPFKDPFKRFEQSWTREMPNYEIKKWNSRNVDLDQNEWMCRASKANAPVFLSEFIRWDVLHRYGGMYIDADCEILNGRKLNQMIDELYNSDDYDAFIGIEEQGNGHPTAQTVAAKPGSALVEFMHNMYSKHLSGPLWHWREERSLIGPQLMSLYFRDQGLEKSRGFFPELSEPAIFARVKVYPQDYFSPKFTIKGSKLNYTANTVIYHLFANLNVSFSDEEALRHRASPMLFEEYCNFLSQRLAVLPDYAKKAELEGYPGSLWTKKGRIHKGRLLRYAMRQPRKAAALIRESIGGQ